MQIQIQIQCRQDTKTQPCLREPKRVTSYFVAYFVITFQDLLVQKNPVLPVF